MYHMYTGLCRHVISCVYLCYSCVQRNAAVEPLATPIPDGQVVVLPPKIEKLVSDISQLTLLEVSELSSALKQRLNLPDAPMMAMGAAPAAQVQVTFSSPKRRNP